MAARLWEMKFWKKVSLKRIFETCIGALNGKKVALFGSYGWGDGEWMRNWEERCRKEGVSLICEGVICNEMPDDEGLMQCRK